MAAWTGVFTDLSLPTNPPKADALLALVVGQQQPRLGDPLHVHLAGGAAVTIETQGGHAYSGFVIDNMYDKFYQGVYIIPAEIAFGNLVKDETVTFLIWNAEFVTHTLTSVTGENLDGVTLEAIPLPLTLGSLVVKQYSIDAEALGAPAIDGSYFFGFAAHPTVELPVTGVRLVAWTFRPDWSQGVLERLTWLTDVMVSDSAAEQRRAVRTSPRRELEAEVTLHAHDRQYFEIIAQFWGGRTWLLPIWPEVGELQSIATSGTSRVETSTADREYMAGGYAVIAGQEAINYEIVEIDSLDASGLNIKGTLTGTWPKGTRVYPARPAKLVVQPSVSRVTDELHTAGVQFLIDEPCDVTPLAPTLTYLGFPVIEERPDEVENLTRGYQRLLLALDNSIGRPYTKDSAERALSILGFRWFLAGRAQVYAFRRLCAWFEGRLKAAWLPTHGQDLTVVDALLPVQTHMDIKNIGYSKFGGPGRKDLYILLADGTVFMRRIIAAQELTSGVERIFLDSTLGLALEPSDFARISWLNLYRQETDTVEIQFETDMEGLALSQSVFREVRDNEL